MRGVNDGADGFILSEILSHLNPALDIDEHDMHEGPV